MGLCLTGLIFGIILLAGAMKISNRVAPDVVNIDEDLHALDIEDVYYLSDQVAILGLVIIRASCRKNTFQYTISWETKFSDTYNYR